MLIRKLNLFFLVVLTYTMMGQDFSSKLPYSDKSTYSNKSSTGVVLAEMIDELGHKFYWATDSLLDDEKKQTFNSRNLPRLLMKGIYQMSQDLVSITFNEDTKEKVESDDVQFHEFRRRTLINFKKASTELIESQNAAFLLDWDRFVKTIAIAASYGEEITAFRETIGKSMLHNAFVKEKTLGKAASFETSIGADGLSNVQWLNIMRGGGGAGASDNIRKIGRINHQILIALKKEERATVTTGDLETIKSSSNIVDGVTYTSFNTPPEQLSYAFSNNQELISGIVDWIIHINSGNPIKLSDMFRVGLDVSTNFDNTIDQSLSLINYRDIIDRKSNKVRLEFSNRFFDKIRFSDVFINEVQINNERQIEFFGSYNEEVVLLKNSRQLIILLKDMKGDLLNRIKQKIIQLQEDPIEHDENFIDLENY